MTRQAPDFVHVGRSEGGEGQDTVGLQETAATGKEGGRIGEPLQGGAGGHQVSTGREFQFLGITGHETDVSIPGR